LLNSASEAPSVRAQLNRLPLVTLYLTERCNSRCVTCDYWRHGRLDASVDTVKGMLPDLVRLGTRVALISGGEPLLNPDWQVIANLLKGAGIRLWLLTSGLSLAKHATAACAAFDAITVSMDGTNSQTYARIRGLDAFAKVCEGIRAVVNGGVRVGLRVTLQRANFRELPKFVDLAHELNVNNISFLAVDVANPHAFGRAGTFAADAALSLEDLPVLEREIGELVERRRADFESGFIAESPVKLRRLHQYFAAVLGRADFPPVRCNAPEFSAVVGVEGRAQPCFFIAGPQADSARGTLEEELNSGEMIALRETIRAGKRPECARCVCSLYRDPNSVERTLLP
jgi:Fe-coproporphyrin III synthase